MQVPDLNVQLADLEPVKTFVDTAVRAHELLERLTPEEAGMLPKVARKAAAMLREAVHEGRAEGIIGEVEESDGPTSDELRARYGDQARMVDVAPVLAMLGRADVDERSAVACQYDSLEAHDAFAEGNRRHYGHDELGPVIAEDGTIYGVTILNGG